MEKKNVYRIFTIADYEREALYFREMHAKGWKLRKVSYSILLFVIKYTFEKCQPEQVSYQLDFYPMEKSDRSSYLQLFKDCGWEHITNFNQFSYFRKPASQLDAESDLEIYNDAWSKLEMVKRLLIWRFLPALVALFFATYLVLSVAQKGSNVDWLVKCILLVDTVLLFILFGQLVHIGLSFWRKKQELKD